MLKVEFLKLWEEEIEDRWPKWDHPGNNIIDDWYKTFGHADGEDLIEALRQHKMEDATTKPNSKRVRAFLREILHEKEKEQQRKERIFYKDPDKRYGTEALLEALHQVSKITTTEGLKQRIYCANTFKEYADIDPAAVEWARDLRK